MKSFCLICIAALLFAAASTAAPCRVTGRSFCRELKKIEAALPAEAPAKPAKPRKILIFDKPRAFSTIRFPAATRHLS